MPRRPGRIPFCWAAWCLSSVLAWTIFGIGHGLWSGLAFAAPSGRLAKVVVTDVDGTLMDSAHELPGANRLALRACMQSGLKVVLATGKHCGPWVGRLLSEVADQKLPAASQWTLNAPGVFVQGLLVRDADGKVVSKQKLKSELVETCLQAGTLHGWTVLAYTDDDRIVSNRADPETDRIEALGEPRVEVGAPGSVGILKMLFLGRPEDEAEVREEISRRVEGKASITVAIAGMVEVLPPGASKVDGVQVALDLLGMSARDALALGDGENDLEMLSFVREAGGMAVAVGNARPALKAVANEVVASCDEAGWAQAVKQWALG